MAATDDVHLPRLRQAVADVPKLNKIPCEVVQFEGKRVCALVLDGVDLEEFLTFLRELRP